MKRFRTILHFPVPWAVCFFLLATSGKALAVPSFARQTGLSCITCHTVYPELTAFGRAFKMSGYAFSKSSGSEGYTPPIAAMFQASGTVLSDNSGILTDGVAPFDDATDSTTDKINIPQQASLFYAGRIIDGAGAFAQLTYDGTANDIALDLTDIRWAHTTSLSGKHFTYGLTVNNAPTVSDLWNSTPIWGFPYAGSAVAPGPAAGALIDGALASQVGGLGAYASWNNWIYGEAAVYRTTNDGITRPLGAGTTPDTITDGAVPYWRAAVFHTWGAHAVEIGTYGIQAKVYPGGMDAGPTDQFFDTAFDAQYQYNKGKHIFTAQGTWIHEKQDWDASFPTGAAANSSDDLTTYRINGSYFYRSSMGPVGGSLGYFSISGDTDTGLYGPNPVDGSRTGSPDSDGFIFEVDYVLKQKYKFSLQYTWYTNFNGTSSNYDGSGRDASDNNTLYGLVWLMF